MKDNILLFPGWMQNDFLDGEYSYVNLWEKKYIEPDVAGIKYLVGHSMGSCPALLSWKQNTDATVILFNPLIVKRNSLNLLFRFTTMMLLSPGSVRAWRRRVKLKYLPIAIKNALFFKEIKALEIIKEIPKDKLIIIKGKNDKYFCDLEAAAILCNYKIAFIELADVNHFWCPKVGALIKQLIK